MRILLVLDSYREGDTSEIVYRLCQRWAPMREMTVCSVALGDDGPLSMRLRALHVSTQVLPRYQPGKSGALREAARRLMNRAERPDVINSHGCWPDLGARALQKANPAIPLVSSVYGVLAHGKRPWLERMVYDQIERSTRGRVGAFVFNSRAAREGLGSLRFPGNRTHLISPGVDAVQCYPMSLANREKYRALLGVANDCPLLISAGDLVEEKGHAVLLEAMPHLLEVLPDTRLFIIGDGPLRDDLEKRIKSMGLEKGIKIIGQLGKMLPKLFSSADVVVQPSRAETFSLAVAEALATGTPVVASDVGGLREMVRHGETGLLVPPGNAKVLAEAVLDLLGDGERYDAFCDRARTDMLENYEMGKTAEQYIQLWQCLAPEALWHATDSMPVDQINDEEVRAYLEKESQPTGKHPTG